MFNRNFDGRFLESRPIARDMVIAVLLAAAVAIAYAPSRNHQFLNYDDNAYVSGNPNVNTGLTSANISWAFQTYHMGSWHPLTWLSLQLDAEAWGADPTAFHVVNFLLHAINTALVYIVLRRLTGTIGRSVLVALLFGLHPLRVESVAWVAERKDVLCGLFWLLALLAYQRYAAAPSVSRMCWVVVAFALSLISKPMAVTLPCVLLVLDAWPLGRLRGGRDVWPLFLEKTPLFAMAATFSILTVVSQNQDRALISTESLSIAKRLAGVPVAYVFYLWKTICPVELGVLYPLPTTSRPIWEPLTALAVLVAISYVAYRSRRQQPYLLAGWLWFLGTLIPVIGLLQVGLQAYADRYTYIPHIGLLVAIVWGMADLLAAMRVPLPASRTIAMASVLVCVVISHAQLSYWKDSQSLWKRTTEVTTDNVVAWDNLASDYNAAGQRNAALDCYAKCASLRPESFDYPAKRSIILFQSERYEEAVAECQKAIAREQSRDTETRKWFWYVMGELSRRRGKWIEAADHFETSIGVSDQWWLSHSGLAICLGSLGRTHEAIEQFKIALSLAPGVDKPRVNANLGLAYRHRGLTLLAAGRDDEAREQSREACRVDPSWSTQLFREARALVSHRDAARRNPDMALKLSRLACFGAQPVPPEFLDVLGIAAAADGKFDIAIEVSEQAIDAAKRNNRFEIIAAISNRVRLYRDRRPFTPYQETKPQ